MIILVVKTAIIEFAVKFLILLILSLAVYLFKKYRDKKKKIKPSQANLRETNEFDKPLYNPKIEKNNNGVEQPEPPAREPVVIKIGRNLNCDIVVAQTHDDVSRNHATITVEYANKNSVLSGATPLYDGEELGVRYFFEDTSSLGSFINGNKISKTAKQIYPNDQINLGYTYALNWDEIERLAPSSPSFQNVQNIQNIQRKTEIKKY